MESDKSEATTPHGSAWPGPGGTKQGPVSCQISQLSEQGAKSHRLGGGGGEHRLEGVF